MGAVVGAILGTEIPEARGQRIELTAVNKKLEPLNIFEKVIKTFDLHKTNALINAFKYEINMTQSKLK